MTLCETRQDLQAAILSQLEIGEENGIHGEPLARRLGLTTDREKRAMRLAIVQMRHAGIRVCAGPSGYYLARDEKDIIKSREFIKGYVISECRVMADYKRLLTQVNGQIKMRLV